MKLALIAEFQNEKFEADQNTKPRDTFFVKKIIDGETVPYTYTTGLDLGLKVGATIQYTPESGPPFTLTVTQVLNGELILKDLNRKSRENNRHWRGKMKLKKVYFVPNESNFLEKLMAIHMLNDRALGHMFPDKEMDLRENAVVPSFSFISPLNELQRQAVSDTFNHRDIFQIFQFSGYSNADEINASSVCSIWSTGHRKNYYSGRRNFSSLESFSSRRTQSTVNHCGCPQQYGH